jgi:hypothetical protein
MPNLAETFLACRRPFHPVRTGEQREPEPEQVRCGQFGPATAQPNVRRARTGPAGRLLGVLPLRAVVAGLQHDRAAEVAVAEKQLRYRPGHARRDVDRQSARIGRRAELVGETGHPQRLHGRRELSARLGLVRHALVPFDQQCLDAVAPEKRRGGQTGQPRANNKNGDTRVCHDDHFRLDGLIGTNDVR